MTVNPIINSLVSSRRIASAPMPARCPSGLAPRSSWKDSRDGDAPDHRQLQPRTVY